MNTLKRAQAEQLLVLIDRIYADTEGFIDEPQNFQPWYDRGYANGMIQAMHQLGYTEQIAATISRLTANDTLDGVRQHRWMPWGKAYRHGKEVGYKETCEALK